MLRYPPWNSRPGLTEPGYPRTPLRLGRPGPGASQGTPPLPDKPVVSPASATVAAPIAPGAAAPAASSVQAATWWTTKWPNSPWSKPNPSWGPGPTPPPTGPGQGAVPPLAPGAAYPPVPLLELAAAYVPYQVYSTICPPGGQGAPGTIFPELMRTPPLYRWPPGTDGRY